MEQVSERRLLGVVEGQQRQGALHLRQALPALLALLRQLRLRELQRRLRLALADQLYEVLLLVAGKGTQAYTPAPRQAARGRGQALARGRLTRQLSSGPELLN